MDYGTLSLGNMPSPIWLYATGLLQHWDLSLAPPRNQKKERVIIIIIIIWEAEIGLLPEVACYFQLPRILAPKLKTWQ